MTLFEIFFTDGSSTEEYGYTEDEVRNFCQKVYPDMDIKSIKPY